MTKNTSYHYSIIIPHKNTPRLLERCLYSIPTWDEIQIIIIDDNSNSESVDFSHFPGNGRKNTEVLFTKEGKGAGYARNIGLPRPWQMDYLCRCRRFLYSRLFYYLKRIHGQPP